MRILEQLRQASRQISDYRALLEEAAAKLRSGFLHYTWVGVYDAGTLAASAGTQAAAAATVAIRWGGAEVGQLAVSTQTLSPADSAVLEAVADILAAAWSRSHDLPRWQAATRAVAGCPGSEAGVRPVALAVHPSAAYEFEDMDALERYLENQSRGYIYTRWGNPTIRAAEEAVAVLEGAEESMLCASGMGAIATTLLSLLGSGDEVLAPHNLYGGSYHLMADLLPRWGIQPRFVDVADMAALERHITERTRVIYFEPITNPTLRVVDPRAVVAAARSRGVMTVTDNTVATPMYLRPLQMGVDVVVHSATKYLGGHSDLLAGAVSCRSELMRTLRTHQRHLGTHFNPREAALLVRGIKTFPLRVQRQVESARAVAEWLAARPQVSRVWHPALPSHPEHTAANDLFGARCGLVTFEVGGGLEVARRVVDAMALFHKAASLGGVESLVSIPVLTSHWAVPEETLKRAGVTPGTVRLSVGVEDVGDLIADLDRALRMVPQCAGASR